MAFSVWEFGENVWRWVRWWGLVGVGGAIVVCIDLVHVSGSDEGL